MMLPFDAATRDLLADRLQAFVRLPAEPPAASALTRAAVAMVLVGAAGGAETALLLTLRAAGLRAHGGQWALPGGRCDPGETAVQAALRELHEELGLRLGDADILGQLDDYPTRSGYLITPVVMWAQRQPALRPNPAEVASVHRIALSQMARPRAFDFVGIAESDRRAIRYDHQGGYIHAPTAALLYQFSEAIAGRTTRVADLEQPVFAWR